MKLHKLTLKNFKGLRQKTIEAPDGCSLNIYADNGKGKTTIGDAITYILFDKDMQGRSPQNFGIKTLDENNNVIHNLQHEVEAVFDNVTLRKVYQEKWVRQRGSADKELTGHTTDHFIDDEPVKKKDYEEAVYKIMDEEQFRMLTVPSYLAEQMHWSDRRKVLGQIAGDVDDDEIIKGNDNLNGYKELLDGKSAEGRKAMLSNKRKDYLDSLDNIPDRIDENVRSLVDVGTDGIEAQLKELSAKKSKAEEKLSKARSGGGVSELQVKIEELQTKKQELIKKHDAKFDDSLKGARKLVAEKEALFVAARKAFREAEDNQDNASSSVDRINFEIQEKKRHIELVENKQPNDKPEEPEDGSCFNCGQEMESNSHDYEKEVAEYEEYLKGFNEQKAEDVKDLMGDIESLETVLAENQKMLKKAQKSYEKAKASVDTAKKELGDSEAKASELTSNIPDVKQSDAYIKLDKSQSDLNSKVESIRGSKKSAIEQAQNELSEINSQISEVEGRKFQVRKNAEINERIAELKEELKQAKQNLERVENGLWLIQQFDVAKAQVVTDRVNKLFKTVRWKMFEPQMNGGINDQLCEAIVNGVPYGDGLNNAARIQSGLEIISVLGKHFGKQAPVVVDNAEAITDMDTFGLQVIALYVSKKDKQLRIEEVK